jgi:hypothetical protein
MTSRESCPANGGTTNELLTRNFCSRWLVTVGGDGAPSAEGASYSLGDSFEVATTNSSEHLTTPGTRYVCPGTPIANRWCRENRDPSLGVHFSVIPMLRVVHVDFLPCARGE